MKAIRILYILAIWLGSQIDKDSWYVTLNLDPWNVTKFYILQYMAVVGYVEPNKVG